MNLPKVVWFWFWDFLKLKINKKSPSEVGEFFTSNLSNFEQWDFTQAQKKCRSEQPEQGLLIDKCESALYMLLYNFLLPGASEFM